MRVFLLLVLLGVTACSAAPESSLRGSSSKSSKARPGAPATETPSGTSAPSSPAPPPTGTQTSPAPSTSNTSTPPPPTTPAVPGSCEAPKCIGAFGTCGCKATGDVSGTITMGCQDGLCSCFDGNEETTTFEGDCNGGEDAKQLFFANCGCQ